MKKVLLLWYTGNNNFGDVLIYETVKDVLEKAGMQIGYLDVGQPCREVFKEANKYDFLLFAGGGIIERYIPNVIRYFKEDFCELAVPYGIIGLSIGRFDYSDYREQLRFWIEQADFFYTRDHYSASYLNELCGITKVKEGVDVVWANRRICSKKNLEQKSCGINVRDVPYTDIQRDMDWQKLKEIVGRLGIDCVIQDESEQDQKVNLMEYEEACSYSVDTTLKQIWNCKMVIAMRYHVVLVAAANGIPVLPIVYCPKVLELAKQIGLEKYTVGVDEIDDVEEKFTVLWEHAEQEKESLKIHYADMKREAEQILTQISKIINDTKER